MPDNAQDTSFLDKYAAKPESETSFLDKYSTAPNPKSEAEMFASGPGSPKAEHEKTTSGKGITIPGERSLEKEPDISTFSPSPLAPEVGAVQMPTQRADELNTERGLGAIAA